MALKKVQDESFVRSTLHMHWSLFGWNISRNASISYFRIANNYFASWLLVFGRYIAPKFERFRLIFVKILPIMLIIEILSGAHSKYSAKMSAVFSKNNCYLQQALGSDPEMNPGASWRRPFQLLRWHCKDADFSSLFADFVCGFETVQ